MLCRQCIKYRYTSRHIAGIKEGEGGKGGKGEGKKRKGEIGGEVEKYSNLTCICDDDNG